LGEDVPTEEQFLDCLQPRDSADLGETKPYSGYPQGKPK